MLPGPPWAVGTVSAPLRTLEKSGLAPASGAPPPPSCPPVGLVLAPLWTLEKSGFRSLLMRGRSSGQWMCPEDGGTQRVKDASRRLRGQLLPRVAPGHGRGVAGRGAPGVDVQPAAAG